MLKSRCVTRPRVHLNTPVDQRKSSAGLLVQQVVTSQRNAGLQWTMLQQRRRTRRTRQHKRNVIAILQPVDAGLCLRGQVQTPIDCCVLLLLPNSASPRRARMQQKSNTLILANAADCGGIWQQGTDLTGGWTECERERSEN